ncbi:MAG TPA: MFS transporter, partial [Thermomonospora sp.]|nr:MFS transporter [Thermomonospora sp.]
MRTYRDLARTPQFTALFWTSTAHVAAHTITGLALGTLIYATTGSPLLAALAMFGTSLTQVIGAATLLSAADRLPPRTALTALSASFAAGTAALAIPDLPAAATVALVAALGVLASLAGGVRYGLLTEILPPDGYVLGRSALNMSSGLTQICGFAAGGALVTLLSPR